MVGVYFLLRSLLVVIWQFFPSKWFFSMLKSGWYRVISSPKRKQKIEIQRQMVKGKFMRNGFTFFCKVAADMYSRWSEVAKTLFLEETEWANGVKLQFSKSGIIILKRNVPDDELTIHCVLYFKRSLLIQKFNKW